MVKKILALLFVCMAVAGGFGCGGQDVTITDKVAPLEQNPGLQEAQRAEAAGEPLSGSQQRILKEAREDGVIQ